MASMPASLAGRTQSSRKAAPDGPDRPLGGRLRGLGAEHVQQQRGGPAEVVAAVALGGERVVVLAEAGALDQADHAALDLGGELALAVLPQPTPDQPVG